MFSVAASERPNILYIFTDDQSYRTVGCYPGSYDWVKTPNIDNNIPIKNIRLNLSPNIRKLPRVINIGAKFARSVAFAMEVNFIDQCQNERSPAKKTPAIAKYV